MTQKQKKNKDKKRKKNKIETIWEGGEVGWGVFQVVEHLPPLLACVLPDLRSVDKMC